MRVYDGCPDSKLQARLDLEQRLLARLKKLVPEASCTYFPMEETYQAHVWGNSLSGFHHTRLDALNEAIRLQEMK